MAVIVYDGFYTNTDFSGHIGGTTPSAQSDQQRYNARKIYNYFHALGWTDQAIAGMIGNMAQESWLDPANLTPTGGRTWPQSNQQMLNYSGALGLVQWHSRITAYIRFCERYGIDWASGESQLFRMKREIETERDGSYHWWKPGQYMGQTWDYAKYSQSTMSPEDLAMVWMYRYEQADTTSEENKQKRKDNANYYYQLIQSGWSGVPDVPPGPDDPTPPTPGPDDPQPPPGPHPDMLQVAPWILALHRKKLLKKKIRGCRN